MKLRSFMTGCIGLIGLVVAVVIPSPASSTTIYQCAQKVHGQLRLVSAPSDCLPSEKSIVLNIPDVVPVVVHGSVVGFPSPVVVANGADGSGFTFSTVQPGQYVVTFDTAFAAAPDCQASALNPPINLVGYCTTITSASTTQVGVACRFFLFPDGSSILRDQDFTLICVL